MASIFSGIEVGPKIEVFALNKAYQDDPSFFKVNLGVGGKLFTVFLFVFIGVFKVLFKWKQIVVHLFKGHIFWNANKVFAKVIYNLELQRMYLCK